MLYNYNITLVKNAVNKIFMHSAKEIARPHFTGIRTMVHNIVAQSSSEGGTICLVFCDGGVDDAMYVKLGEVNKAALTMPEYIKEYTKVFEAALDEANKEDRELLLKYLSAEFSGKIDLYTDDVMVPLYKAYYTIAPNTTLNLPYKCGLLSRLGDALLASADVGGIKLSISAEHISEYVDLSYDSHDIEDCTDHNGYNAHHLTKHIAQE